MAKTRYKLYFQKMIDENSVLFEKFGQVHKQYETDDEKFQDEFNQIGKKVKQIIHEYENRVCANTDNGLYARYSGNLAEKFQQEVRNHFPLIDHIGIISQHQPSFEIKKIDLSNN